MCLTSFMCLAAATWRIDMMMLWHVVPQRTQWPGGTKLEVAAVILQLKNDIEDIIAGHGILAYVSYVGCLQGETMRNCDCIEGYWLLDSFDAFWSSRIACVFPLPQSFTINNCFRPVQGEEYICVAIVGTNASSSDMLRLPSLCHAVSSWRSQLQRERIIQHHLASSSQVLAMIVVACYYVGDLVFPWMRQCGWWGASQIVSFWCPPHTLHRKNLGFCRLQDGSPWIEIEICLKHHKKLGSVKCLIFCTSNSLPLFGQGTKIAMPLYTKLI